jgi:hypothetical protein
MKKSILLLSLCSLGFGISGKAQFFIGGGLSANRYGADVGILPAIQPRLGYDFSEGKISFMAGFNFSPLTKKNDFSVPYFNSDGSYQDVAYSEKIAINNLFFHLAYRVGSPENAFRFKFIAGVSTDFISLKYEAKDNIPAGYQTDYDVKNATLSGPKLDLGIGGDYRINNRGDLFFELILGLPANQANGEYINNPTVGHQGLSIGYHFYFGEREYAGY